MSGYTLPFTITPRIIDLVASVSEKTGQILSRKDLENKPHLRRSNRIRSIHASLKIEANSLSLTNVRDVIDGRPVLGDPIEIREVQNAYRAYKEIQKIDPYNLLDLKRVHGILTAGIITGSGVFRKGEEGVFSGEHCIFIAPPPRRVPGLMAELFTWMRENRSELHPLILSAVFHYEFVFIHPFSDGNGRMARLWHTALLANWRSIFEWIPLESQIEKFQDEYYAAISACHQEANSEKFIEFILTKLDQVLNDFINNLRTSPSEISEAVEKLLRVMEFDMPMTANALMGRLNLKSKENFRKNYLDPAIEKRLIERTIPEKPSSRNQRYVKR